MNKIQFIKSYAKINLCLNIINKKKKLHKIQSLFSLISLHDKICAFPIKKKNHKIFFKGKFSKNIPRINTIQKTLKLLEKEGLLKKKLYVIVYKNIPQKSGLGGGSMNSASLIKLLIKKKIVKINNDKLTNISDKIGDDVKIGFKRNLIYLDNNKIFTNFKKRLKYYLLLFMPKKGCSTRHVYSKVRSFSRPYDNKKFIIKNLSKLKNDLEKIVINKYPELKSPINFIKKAHGLEFLRMTGSGSCFVAYFKYNKDSISTLKKFKKKYPNYWSVLSKTV